jgi:cation transport protein ChaC
MPQASLIPDDPVDSGGWVAAPAAGISPERGGNEANGEAMISDGHSTNPDAEGALWVFGYGSLMWNPGFPFAERHAARLNGLHRALCVYSVVHRGTAERPGLVLGLDRGGACRGYAFRVAPGEEAATLAYLREREQITAIYVERRCRILLDDGRHVVAVTYVVDRSHRQYAGRLPHKELLRIVAGGRGQSGHNPDYVLATRDHLVELGVHDATLDWLAGALRPRSPPG